jgi:hypothetical protein
MWAFLSAKLRMWLIVAIGAPLLGWLLGRLGDAIEARHGRPTMLSRTLQKGRGWLRRRTRGPLAPRPVDDAPVTDRPAADPGSVRDTGSPAR